MHNVPLEVPVLIIGGGPTGLLQAHLLAELQVKCLIIERYPETRCAKSSRAISKIPRDMSTIQPGCSKNSRAWYQEGGCILGKFPHEPEWKIRGCLAVRAHGCGRP